VQNFSPEQVYVAPRASAKGCARVGVLYALVKRLAPSENRRTPFWERQAPSLACLPNVFPQAKRGIPPCRAKASAEKAKAPADAVLLPELSSDLGLLVPSSRTPPSQGDATGPSPTEPLIACASRLADSAVVRQDGDGSGFPPSHIHFARDQPDRRRGLFFGGTTSKNFSAECEAVHTNPGKLRFSALSGGSGFGRGKNAVQSSE
jgi:hypothetical protein